jgi:fucokinase
LPVQVTAEVIQQPVVEITSMDLGVTRTLTTLAEIKDYANAHDPLAIHKAAVCLITGADNGEAQDLPALLKTLGGGIRLSSDVRLPKGTGLGTSSVLAAALVKALVQLASGEGFEIPQHQLFDAASLVEQMLTTGGGWQDQVGGMVPGIKLTTSAPGIFQDLHVRILDIPPRLRREMDERLIVLDTGQRRLARNLLREIMGSWLRRDRGTTAILAEIQLLAQQAAVAIELGKFVDLGQILWRHWELNKQLDAGTTNPFIDGLIEALRPYVEGVKLAGAGGGGFLMAISKPGAKGNIHRLVQEDFANANVTCHECRIYW